MHQEIAQKCRIFAKNADNFSLYTIFKTDSLLEENRTQNGQYVKIKAVFTFHFQTYFY